MTSDVAPGLALADRAELPRRGRPRNPRVEGAVLRAAIQVLQEVGYRDLSLNEVVRRAGVGRPALYRRWPSKASLAIAAVAEWLGPVYVPDTGSLESDLRGAADDAVELLNQPGMPAVIASLLAEALEDGGVASELHEHITGARRDSILTALERAIARGELAAATDTVQFADLFSGTLLYQAVSGRPPTTSSADALVTRLLDAFDVRARQPEEEH